MRKFSLSFFTLSLLLLGHMAMAQVGNYRLTATTGTYTELASPTNVTTSLPWDSTANFTMPIGFTFKVWNTTTDNVYLHRANSFCTDTFNSPILNGFQLFNSAMIDRGSGSSNSPIGYELSGTAGSRIFKMQIKNAGFIQELIAHSTLNDYTNVQLWLYEDSNIVELHFGPSQVTTANASDYFGSSAGEPIIGYSRRKNMTGDGTMFPVSGFSTSISNLELNDSVVFSSHNITYLGQCLFGYPTNGTILRFTPSWNTGVNAVNIKEAHVYPTVCKSELLVDYTTTTAEKTTFEVISIKGIPTTMKGILQNGTTVINLSNIAAGSYILRLQNSSGKFTQKFVKL